MNFSLPSIDDLFSENYFVARERFVEAARKSANMKSIPVSAVGPKRESLFVDVAELGCVGSSDLLLVTSGLHGVEGYFGSAVQLALLRAALPCLATVRLVLVHALNPFGFACNRRSNERNVDLNRNFLLAGERYEGCPDLYQRLDRFLNPKRAPSRWDLLMLATVAMLYGKKNLGRAISAGQYDYHEGLFYGGQEPSETLSLCAAHLSDWVGNCERIVHLDFHTGLGRFGANSGFVVNGFYGSLAFQEDRIRRESQQEKTNTTTYRLRGDIGRWFKEQLKGIKYMHHCAEFGTYDRLRVLAALRNENQAHYWSKPGDPIYERAKHRIKEVFCPVSLKWRQQVIEGAFSLISDAVACSVK